MNIDLTKIKKDITWLINQVKCFISVFPAATTWSNKHSATTGNKYLKDTLVWDDGFIYKCLVDNNSNPTSNSFYWEKVTKGWLLQQEQADWNATGGPSFIRNKPTSLGGGSETDPVFTAWLDTDPLEPYYLASNPAGYITLEDLPTPVIPTFQQVTTAGATSTNGVTFTDIAGNTTYIDGGDVVVKGFSANPGDENIAVIVPSQAYFRNQILTTLYQIGLLADINSNNVGIYMAILYGGLEAQISIELADDYYTNIDPINGNYPNFKIPFKPTGDYTWATLDDIPSGNYLPLAGGTMDTDADILFANGSKISEGLVDAGTGGNKGIALTCAVGYEWKFEAGEAYLTSLSGNIISVKDYARFTPTINDDSTKGYSYYSHWNTIIGTTWRCLDATPGAAIWEQINIFSNLVPYTGAANSVDLGAYSLKAGSLVTQTNGPTKSMTLNSGNLTTEHTAEWQDKDYIGIADITDIPTNTSQLINDGADGINPFITVLDIPPSTNGLPTGGTAGQILTKVDATDYNATWQDNYADWTSVVKHTVKNNGASGTITKGTAVYVTGADGTNMLVGRASNVSEATSSKTMGLMQSDITTTGGTQTGFVITEGLLGGLNTAGQTAGDPVWLGVNGALIYGLINKPYAPAHLVFIGIVTKVSAGSGEIFVKVQNGFELNEIHDVDLKSNLPTNNQLLAYESATSLWKNKDLIDILETFNTTQGFYFFEDFLGNPANSTTNTINISTSASGTGASCIPDVTSYPNRTNQQGVMRMGTGTTATGASSIRLGDNNSTTHYLGNGVYTMQFFVNIETLSTLSERFYCMFGGVTTGNLANTNGIFFIYDEGIGTYGAASPNFKCVTRSGLIGTTTITSIPVVASQWYVLKIVVNANATSVEFFIDGVSVAINTTNIPTLLTPRVAMTKTTGTTNRNMFCDYFLVKQVYTNPR